jgi:tripartite-type tricarboxylate transporter receptor subunit TctC
MTTGVTGSSRFDTLGIEPLAASPDDTAAYVRAELEKYRRIVRAAGIRAD